MRELNLRIPGGEKGGRKGGKSQFFVQRGKKRDELVKSARRWKRDGAGFDQGKKNRGVVMNSMVQVCGSLRKAYLFSPELGSTEKKKFL